MDRYSEVDYRMLNTGAQIHVHEVAIHETKLARLAIAGTRAEAKSIGDDGATIECEVAIRALNSVLCENRVARRQAVAEHEKKKADALWGRGGSSWTMRSWPIE